MSNDYFNHSANVVPAGSRAVASHVNNIADEIAVGLDKLPTEAEIKQGSINYAVDSGAADAYVVTLTYTPTLTAGLSLTFKVANTNTGASTLNVNGTGAKAIVVGSATALVAGELVENDVIEVCYDGTSYQLMRKTISGLPLTGGTITGDLTVTGQIHNFKGAFVYKTGAWVATATGTDIEFDTELYDTSSFFTVGSSATRLTIPANVAYVRLNASVVYGSLDAGKYARIRFSKNGTTFIGGSNSEYNYNASSAIHLTTPIIPVSEGDYFEVTFYHNATSDPDLITTQESVWFAIQVIA